MLMACIVMAYTGMAVIDMACIAMAYKFVVIVMHYTVMADIVMACMVMAYLSSQKRAATLTAIQ